MNYRDIQYITTAAAMGSFAKAAKLCHISQPSLSIQIKKAENRLGQALFIRHKSGVRLSPFGLQALPYLTAVQDNILALNRCADRWNRKQPATLKLGAIATVAPYIFSKIADLDNIIFTESTTAELTEKLLEDKIDAALLAIPIKAPLLQSILLYKEPFFLAAADNYPNLATVDLENLGHHNDNEGDCRLVVLSEEHCLAEQVLHLCHADVQNALSPFRATSLEVARRLVAEGKGITLIPATAQRDDDGLQYRSLDSKYHRAIGLVYKAQNRKLATIEALAQTLKHLNLGTV